MSKWIPFSDPVRHGWKEQPLPPERKYVLCHLAVYSQTPSRCAKEGVPLNRVINDSGAVVVGFMKFAAGDPESPMFVCSAVDGTWEVVAWCDCLDGVEIPNHLPELKEPAEGSYFRHLYGSDWEWEKSDDPK